MKTLTYEKCIVCDNETGRAGAGEDSLYINDDGPFCEDCHVRCQRDKLLEAAKDAYCFILVPTSGTKDEIKEKLVDAIAACE